MRPEPQGMASQSKQNTGFFTRQKYDAPRAFRQGDMKTVWAGMGLAWVIYQNLVAHLRISRGRCNTVNGCANAHDTYYAIQTACDAPTLPVVYTTGCAQAPNLASSISPGTISLEENLRTVCFIERMFANGVQDSSAASSCLLISSRFCCIAVTDCLR